MPDTPLVTEGKKQHWLILCCSQVDKKEWLKGGMWDKILESQRKLRKRNDLEWAARIEKQLLYPRAQRYTRYGRNHPYMEGMHKNQGLQGKAKF